MSVTKMMTDAEITALDELLNYTADYEMKDYEMRDYCEQQPSTNHIYRSIYILAKWRGRDVSKWPNPS